MDKKILSLNDSPYDTYNSQRNLHSILLTSDDENDAAWVYNAFIQVFSTKKLHTNMVFNYNIDSSHTTTMYDKCLLLECFNICDELVPITAKDISELCVDFINNDFYITLTVDKHHIKKYGVEKESTYFHDIFIYGYDLENRQLLAIDYFNNMPQNHWITFEELKNAYESGKTLVGFVNGMFIMRKTAKYRWRFDINNYKENIEAYINCQPMVLYNYKYDERYDYGYNDRTNSYFGLDCYKTFHLTLDESEKYRIGYSMNLFHLLMKHKLLLMNSVEYIIKNKYIHDKDKELYNKFSDIYKDSRLLFNWALKYNSSSKSYILTTLRKLLHRIEAKERDVLKELLTKLSHKTTIIQRKQNDTEKWSENYDNNGYVDRLIHKKNTCIIKVFYGSSLSLLADTGPEYGKCKITIDSAESVIYDQYSAEIEQNRLIFTTQALQEDYHILKVTPLTESRLNISEIISDELSAEYDKTICKYIGTDNTTQGDWKTRYGNRGYDILYKNSDLPGNVAAVYKHFHDGEENYSVEFYDERDTRALQMPNSDDRIIASICSKWAIYVEIAATGGTRQKISLYFIDHKKAGIEQTISIVDISTGKEIYSSLIKDFYDGIYLVFELHGCFRIHIKNNNISCPNSPCAILNGIFIDEIWK